MSSPSEAQVQLPGPGSQSSGPDAAYATADKFVIHKNYFQATKQYQEAEDGDSNDARLYSRWAYALLRRRQYLEALEKCLKALEQDPAVAAEQIETSGDGSTVFNIWVNAFDKLTKNQQASTSQEFVQAISRAPQPAAAYRYWADALQAAGKYKEAADKARKALAVDPADAAAWRCLGYCLLRLNKPLDEFTAAEAASPNAALYKGWADALFDIGNDDEASKKYEAAAAIQPMDATLWMDWGVRLRREHPDEAAKKFRRAIQIQPSLVEARLALGELLSDRDAHDAMQQYLHAIETDPGSIARINYYKWISALGKLSEGEQEIAWTNLQQIAEREPGGVTAYFNVRRRVRRGAKPPIADLKIETAGHARAAKALPHSPGAFEAWANALYRQGKDEYPEAVEKYLKAIELGLDPSKFDYVSWDSAFQSLADTEQQATAARLDELVESKPERVVAYVRWGDVLSGDKKYQKAARKYEAAIRVKPDDANAHAGLAKALHHEKLYSKAVEHFLKACETDLTVTTDCDEWIEALDQLPDEKRGEAIQSFHDMATDNRPEAAQAYASWGGKLYNLKRYAEAIDQYRRAAELNPESVDVLSGWGTALIDSRHYAEAADRFEKAVELDPDNEDGQANAVYNYWGLALHNRGRYTEAVRKYRKAIELSPSAADVYLNLGNVLYDQKNWSEWAKACQKAAQEDPGYVSAYLDWGAALLAERKDSEAKEKYDRAIQISADSEPNLADRYYYWGNAFADQNRAQEAIDKYREAILKNPHHAYAHTNIAAYSNDQGQYRTYWSEMEEAVKAYDHELPKARKEGNVDHFRYYGSVLKELGRRDDAEKIYLEGLRIAPDHFGMLADLVDLYLEQSKNVVTAQGAPDREARSAANWRARETYRRAEAYFEREFDGTENARVLLQWGGMHLSMEEYAKAKDRLQEAILRDPESADAYNQIGILHMRQEEFQEAARCFRDALRRDPGKLTVRSNLAEACLKAGLPDQAETEYKRILSVTGNHVESEIGLGQVCIAMAEASKDSDHYEDAVYHFTRAIDIGKSNPSSASKRLESREWAAVYYSLGYARVKLYGASKLKDEELLQSARENLQQCLAHDREYYKAERALKKIRERLHPFSSERLLERFAPYTILLMAAFVFVLTQISFAMNGKFSELKYYVPVTFGSLILMIAGFYLPKLLKLKVAGIELEKSGVDQIASLSSIEISK